MPSKVVEASDDDYLPAIAHDNNPSKHIHIPDSIKSSTDDEASNGHVPAGENKMNGSLTQSSTGDKLQNGHVASEEVEGSKASSNHPMLIIVMGVSSCGKSTVGQALADSLGVPFVDADKLHPKSNIEKMSAGIPLTDEDRKPWLELVRTTVEHMCAEQEADLEFTGRRGVVVGCSSLKARYRAILRGEEKPSSLPEHLEPPHPTRLPTYFVYIKGERDALMERMLGRKGHFMKSNMLDSQLATLESPEGEEGVVVVDLEEDISTQVQTARTGLHALAGDL